MIRALMIGAASALALSGCTTLSGIAARPEVRAFVADKLTELAARIAAAER